MTECTSSVRMRREWVRRFVVVGDAGVVLRSGDGVDWSVVAAGIAENLWAVTYGNGVVVAVGSGSAVYTSDDFTKF